MRYLGLDLGSKTLGVSVSDASGILANSYKVIHHDENYDDLLSQVEFIVKEKGVNEIVLGFPKHLNNDVGDKAKLSIWFQKQLQDRLKIPVHLQDERWTTRQAENLLISNNTSRKKRKQVIDSVAATIILQSYLDRRKK